MGLFTRKKTSRLEDDIYQQELRKAYLPAARSEIRKRAHRVASEKARAKASGYGPRRGGGFGGLLSEVGRSLEPQGRPVRRRARRRRSTRPGVMYAPPGYVLVRKRARRPRRRRVSYARDPVGYLF